MLVYPRTISLSRHKLRSNRLNWFNRTFSAKSSSNPDEKIANEALMLPIDEVLKNKIGLEAKDSVGRYNYSLYGPYKAKLNAHAFGDKPSKGKLVVVTAMTPTKAGEGKTCTSVGLGDALNLFEGKTGMVALREPSLGPVFGMKGGAAGGGYAQLNPMGDINLHFTGDMHAITSAHNLLAAMLDNHIQWNLEPRPDVRRIEFKRVLDMNDRTLRKIVVGLGGTGNGTPREDGFDITVASEVMAVFCLATSLSDLKERLGKIVVGYTRGGKEAVTAKDVGADGAMTALLRDAFEPNIVQSLENNLGLVHGGPFANIAHGCNSIVATQTALKLADYVVTEGGFGADLGFEKFCNIKCRKGGLKPSCAVIVATVRALKLHGGADEKQLGNEDVSAVTNGMPNLLRHIENVGKFGLPAVVSINRFPTDTDAEVQAVQEECKKLGVDAVVSEQWQHGGKGCKNLAERVIELCESDKSDFKLLYEDNLSLKNKVEKIATELYRAEGVSFSKTALTKLKKFEKMGYGNFPVCIAKTQYSFSDDPKAINAPVQHTLNVSDVRLAAGAEFVVILCGDIMQMPGLPKSPSALSISVDEKSGEIVGLF